jgi:hypothetical protein
MPKFNIWKRPMPQKRVKNMLNRWYAKMVNSLLPPLPESEWHHLLQLSTGAKPFKLIQRRRSQGRPDLISSSDFKKILYLDPGAIKSPEDYVKTPSAQVEDTWNEDEMSVQRLVDDILESELQVGRHRPTRRNRKDIPYRLTPRTLKRIYGKILRHCSFIEKDSRGRWKVTWGSQILDAKPSLTQLNDLFNLVANGPTNIALFEGKELR